MFSGEGWHHVLKCLFFFFCAFSLSQYSEENMMDPYNLAICFGPTLMSVPEGHDQVSCQAHVNELIKTIIIHHDAIFPGPPDLQGPIYTIPGTGEDFWWECSPRDLRRGGRRCLSLSASFGPIGPRGSAYLPSNRGLKHRRSTAWTVQWLTSYVFIILNLSTNYYDYWASAQ